MTSIFVCVWLIKVRRHWPNWRNSGSSELSGQDTPVGSIYPVSGDEWMASSRWTPGTVTSIPAQSGQKKALCDGCAVPLSNAQPKYIIGTRWDHQEGVSKGHFPRSEIIKNLWLTNWGYLIRLIAMDSIVIGGFSAAAFVEEPGRDPGNYSDDRLEFSSLLTPAGFINRRQPGERVTYVHGVAIPGARNMTFKCTLWTLRNVRCFKKFYIL